MGQRRRRARRPGRRGSTLSVSNWRRMRPRLAPEGRPQRDLLPARGRARQEEARDVRAGDQEDDPDRGLQHEQLAAHVAHQVFLQRERPRPPRSSSEPATGTSRRWRVSARAARRGPGTASRPGGGARRPASSRSPSSPRSAWDRAAAGTQSCAAPEGKWNPGGITPTTCRSTPSTVIVRPDRGRIAAERGSATARGSAARCGRGRDGRRRPRSARPRAAPRPSTENRFAETVLADQARGFARVR